jgi:hypothetical protein
MIGAGQQAWLKLGAITYEGSALANYLSWDLASRRSSAGR